MGIPCFYIVILITLLYPLLVKKSIYESFVVIIIIIRENRERQLKDL